jgi:hypothetical protein
MTKSTKRATKFKEEDRQEMDNQGKGKRASKFKEEDH